MRKISCFALLILLIFPMAASADDDSPPGSAQDDVKLNLFGSGEIFRLSPFTDSILLGAGAALSGGDLILDNVLKVNRQKYDGKSYDKDDVNPFDRKFMHQYAKKRDVAADFVLAASLAAPAVLALNEKSEWLTCGVMYAETLLIANGIKEITKLAVSRSRPYMYYDAGTFPSEDVEDGDWANSFPSGHSTMAFAGAAFASYTFCKYFPESKLKIPVVAGSYGLACSVAALRILSGNHFMTDILAGAAIGSITGFLVPWLHTFNTKHRLNMSLLANGVSFAVRL